MGGWVSMSGSYGIDHSVNPAAVPLSGYSQVILINENPKRNYVEIQNQSTSLIQVVRDDPPPVGSGGNVTTIMLAAAATAGNQGGGWNSQTFKGRIRVYVPSGVAGSAQVAAYED